MNSILTIEEVIRDYFISPDTIVIEHNLKPDYYSITIGRADGEGQHRTIDLTPEQYELIRGFR